MRKFILNVHLYGGLLCSAYLIIFGFSSLHFNHQFGFAKPRNTKVTWEEPLQFEAAHDNDADAQAIRDRLNLMGWTLPWKTSRDGTGNLHFDIARPGKDYTIDALASEGKVRVEERRKGFWNVVVSLHALEQVPRSGFSHTWGYYTEFCTAVVLFAALSGVWLWASSKRERKIGLWTLLAALGGSLGFMVYVVWRG